MRRQVCCRLFQRQQIISTGYNGATKGIFIVTGGILREKLGIPSGEKHELCRGIHAEQNANYPGIHAWGQH
jgi:dCMP deaminase